MSRRSLAAWGRWLGAVLLALAPAPVHPACARTLTLPAGTSSYANGWCAPYAASSQADAHATCAGVTVPPGAVLAFGTCALPGASCVGETALTLLGDGGPLDSVERVELNSSVAALAQGCVLGARCSYAEFRNPALSAASVTIAEGCAGTSPCAGVVAWRLGPDGPLLPALSPAATTAVAFDIVALQPVTLTGLAGTKSGAGAVLIQKRTGSAFATGALASSSGWTTLSTLTLSSGAVAGLLVTIASGSTLTCAHALGNRSATLLADGTVQVLQGVQVANALSATAATGVACAWDSLQVSYNLATCAPSPPPPVAFTPATIAGIVLVNTLADLRAALASVSVYEIHVNQHITLDGTPLAIGMTGVTTRTLTLFGTTSCGSANLATPLCSLSGAGASRVLDVQEGVTLRLAHLLLRDGLASAGQDGGCVNAPCATCRVSLDLVEFRNCSAPTGRGGGLAASGGGSLVITDVLIDSCTATLGGGLLDDGGSVNITRLTVTGCAATGDSSDASIVLAVRRGPSGGGMALHNVTGGIADSSFVDNWATTTDVVLLANPDFAQARGGGLLVASSAVNMSTTVFGGNTAFYGGGVYLYNSSMWIDACALRDNIATRDGGGLFAIDCPHVCTARSLISSNVAGGHTGGGYAAINTYLDVIGSIFQDNAAPNGCGGGLGLDAGAFSTVMGDSVLVNNSALRGGGLCCDWCESFTAQQATLYNNVATADSGGAVYLDSSPSTLLNVTMFGNQAPAGGAVSAQSSDLNMTGCNVRDNVATQTHGGAVFHDARSHGTGTLVLNSCEFLRNTCNAGGGAVAAFSSTSAVATLCFFSNNTITAASPAGGAFMSLDVTSLLFQACQFTWNWVEFAAALGDDAPLGYQDAVFASGTGSGGAVWIGSDEPLSAAIRDSNFSHNWAVTGGGIYLTGAVQFSMSNTYMEHCHAYGESSEGGGILTNSNVTSVITGSEFFSNEAVRGGHSWHGGTSSTTYALCFFNENEGKPGDDTKGTTIYVGEAARVLVRDSIFYGNIGPGIAEGTICLGGSNVSHLSIQNTTFDGNSAYLGSCLMLTVPSQSQQLSLSAVAFRNNRAFVGAVAFTECGTYEDIRVSCPTCDLSYNNSAENYGVPMATPPEQFIINMRTQARSGAPLPINVTLKDGFGQTVKGWPDTIATIDTPANISGSLRVFYAEGAAVFKELALRGSENMTYQLDFTLSGPDLFGNDINEKSLSTNLTVQPCEPGETFDLVRLECACAAGFGLVVEDNTCRTCTADEVVPTGSLSCATCPALSAPSNANECVCKPGFYGVIVGATGVCTECPVDTFRGVSDPPALCRSCPVTSQTFSRGATSEKACLCAANYFNDRGGANGTFECAPVPIGGWAPQADSRLFALENFWRPDADHTSFYECSMGNCKKELPMEENVTQLGYNCRDGHTGHLCAVCEQGFAYQGVHCSRCAPGSKFSEWNAAKRSGLIFIGVALLLLAVFLLFFLPLFPRVELMLQAMLRPAAERVEAMLSNIAQASAADRPTSAAKRAAQLLELAKAPEARRAALVREARQSDEARLSASSTSLRPSQPGHRRSHIARLSAAIRLSQPTTRLATTRFASVAGSEFGIGSSPSLFMGSRQRLPPVSRIRVFFDVIGEPVRIIISFWQVVSSFSGNLYVPWPSIYYALANTLNVASLQFLKLPDIACIQPEVSYYTVFNGITLATFGYLAFVVFMYKFGQQTEVLKTDPQRRRRFKSRCLSLCIWGLFLVYPQVSSTTLSIFSCTPLEDGTQWLSADLRIQCFSAKHLLYVGVGILWTLAFPIGIPLAFTLLLYKARVPELAMWKRDCSWLRNIAQRAIVLSVMTTAEIDSDSVTTDSITLEQLRLLHRVFVLCDFAAEAEQPAPVGALTLAVGAHESQLLPAFTDGGSKAVQPASPSVLTQTTTRRKPQTPPPPLPGNPVLALFVRLKRKVAKVSKLRSHTMRKTLSSYFYKNEREQLLMELLDWAKQDKTSLVAEPRSNALRWRTEHEWVHLQLDGVPLSPLDAAERAAFYRYSFLFSSYAIRSWYFETVDLLHKLFLTSIISFIAPRTSVQVIVALMFAFGMVLFVTQLKPYREPANNQLVAIAHVNCFLFLFTGLLLQTNPDGITSNKLVFSIIVGTLTTSIVAFSFYLFVREVARQILNALISADDTEDVEDELTELEEQLEAAEHQDPAQRDSVASDGSALVPWDEGNGNGNGGGTHSDGELHPDGSTPPRQDLASG